MRVDVFLPLGFCLLLAVYFTISVGWAATHLDAGESPKTSPARRVRRRFGVVAYVVGWVPVFLMPLFQATRHIALMFAGIGGLALIVLVGAPALGIGKEGFQNQTLPGDSYGKLRQTARALSFRILVPGNLGSAITLFALSRTTGMTGLTPLAVLGYLAAVGFGLPNAILAWGGYERTRDK